MVTQFTLFPYLCRRFGVLGCLRACTFAFPVAYILTPFAVLMPGESLREGAIFCCMALKGIAGVFAYPCNTILLTNSARSIGVLGTLNGVAVALSAVAKAAGPYMAGQTFTYGIERGYMVLAWWTLAVFGVLGHVSTWWLTEGEGPGAGGARASGAAAGDEDKSAGGQMGLVVREGEAGKGGLAVAVLSSAHDDGAGVTAARMPLNRSSSTRSLGAAVQLEIMAPASRLRSPMRTKKGERGE